MRTCAVTPEASCSNDSSAQLKRTVTLGSVPAEVFDELASWHPDAIWAMGVWERSPRGREIAVAHEGLQFEYEKALPGFKPPFELLSMADAELS